MIPDSDLTPSALQSRYKAYKAGVIFTFCIILLFIWGILTIRDTSLNGNTQTAEVYLVRVYNKYFCQMYIRYQYRGKSETTSSKLLFPTNIPKKRIYITIHFRDYPRFVVYDRYYKAQQNYNIACLVFAFLVFIFFLFVYVKCRRVVIQRALTPEIDSDKNTEK